jgi:hypothetical protein
MTDHQEIRASLDRLANIIAARGFSGVVRVDQNGMGAFIVSGEALVQLHDAQTAILHCPVDQKVLLMEISPDIYFETESLVGQNAVLIRLDRIDDEELSLRLHDAYQFRTPNKPIA